MISTIIVYTKLSNQNEMIAWQSVGISSQGLIITTLAIACILTLIMFVVQ
ncbi:MAG: LptF/LptG family permease [Cyanobacteria bacterium J06633_8]